MDHSQSISESHQLVGALKVDDPSSLWRFTETLRPYFKQVIRSQLNGRFPGKFDESDVVQAALTQAIKNIGTFEGQTEDEWKAWLAAICRNETRNATRHWLRDRRNVAVEKGIDDPNLLAAPSDGGAGGQLARKEVADTVLRGIEELSEEQQMLLQWRHFDNLSHKEIASKLGISVDAARQRWHSTLVQLKNLLGKNGGAWG